jgi:hypothetical protein
LKGKVVSALPAAKPKELTLAIMDDSTPEIKLVLDQVLRGAPPVGTVLEFDMAVPKTFAPEPFLVTAEIYSDQITGIAPEMMPAAPGKKGAAAKKGGAAAPKKGAGKKK